MVGDMVHLAAIVPMVQSEISTAPHRYLDGGPGEMCCLVITDNSARVVSPCIVYPHLTSPCIPACIPVSRRTVRAGVQSSAELQSEDDCQPGGVQYSTWCSTVWGAVQYMVQCNVEQ